MISRETWYREADSRQLQRLRAEVERKNWDAVVPYLHRLARERGLDEPLPELEWFAKVAEQLRDNVVETYQEELGTGSLLGDVKRDVEGMPIHRLDQVGLPNIYQSLRFATHSIPRLIRQGNFGPRTEWAPRMAEWIVEVASKWESKWKPLFEETIQKARHQRDTDPKTVKFREDHPKELEWARERQEQLDRMDRFLKEAPVLFVEEVEAGPLEASEAEEASEAMFQAEGLIEFFGEYLNSYEEQLTTKGHADAALSGDGWFQNQWRQLEGYLSTVESYLIEHRPEFSLEGLEWR